MKKPVITNLERIRRMSVSDLADFLITSGTGSYHTPIGSFSYFYSEEEVRDEIVKWLMSKSE